MSNIFQTQCRSFVRTSFVCMCVLVMSCKNNTSNTSAGYDLTKPVNKQLGKVLNEISGLTFSIEDNSLLAIADSKEKIFQINLSTQKLKDYSDKFYGAYDYEDIVKRDTSIFVLISNGTIVEVPLQAKGKDKAQAYPFWSTRKNDFESLYFDSSINSLIMICKSCSEEKGKPIRSAYRFNLDTKTFDSSAYYQLNIDSVRAELKNDDADFKPSAAAIHPINKKLYILASAGHLLVVADLKGKILEAFELNPDLFPQAEGLAFSPSGTMYISNEKKIGEATLLVFPYISDKGNSRK